MSAADGAPGTGDAAAPGTTSGRRITEERRTLPYHPLTRKTHAQAIEVAWLRNRVWRIGVTRLGFSGVLAVAAYPIERVLVLVSLSLVELGCHLLLWRRASRAGIGPGAVLASQLILVIPTTVFVGLTGGLTGPAFPMLLLVGIGLTISFDKPRELRVTAALFTIAVLALLAMPAAWQGPPVRAPFHAILVALSIPAALRAVREEVVTATDIARQAEARLEHMREEVLAEAKLRAQGLESMGAKVAHELKNPLAAIKGLVQLLSRGATEPRTVERFEVVTREVARMERILLDYLSFSRPLEALRPERMELDAVVGGVLAVVEGRANAQRVELRLERPAEGVSLVGDPRRLKDAFLNLVTNALEATPPGGSVEVAVRPGAEGAGGEVIIRDTGEGIPPHLLPRLGTAFLTTREKGTGLGVALARNVVVQHGGQLSYASEVGRGTTVTVHLPAAPPDARGS